MARKIKRVESYIIDNADAHRTSLDAYAACPAEAFLTYVCDAYDSFEQCLNKFTKKQDGSYNKDSVDSLGHISSAILGTLMGHFETYQKALFAGLVERTDHFADFDVEIFLKNVKKTIGGELSVPTARLLAFRTLKAPVGYVLADAISGWHDPTRVNELLKAFNIKQDIFSNEDITDLEVLWQLRHSIVHTGAWMTLPDAQKVKRLRPYGGKPLIFEHLFINAVSRRFHRLVSNVNHRLLVACKLLVSSKAASDLSHNLDSFLLVKSPKQVWCKA